jgi:hypothetical protein
MFGGDGGGDGPPPVDASGYCGNQIHQVITDPPNLYFVFDASASMDEAGGGGFTKYELVEHDAVLLIETLGALVNFGAAVFPYGATSADPCHVGAQVMPVLPGDPVGPMTGPATEEFIVQTSITPFGGTPTAATLTALLPKLTALKGRTVVILATDGGPNCNDTITCAADQCIPNLEGQCSPPSSNCCGPGSVEGPEGCVDHDATVASVAAIAAAKIPVVVVGIPGSDLYASVLDDMATAGGAAQAMEPFYYRVDDFDTLTQVFQKIASTYVSCDYVLADPPPDEGHTNVYFDGTVVVADPANGWVWKSSTEIELVGDACDALKAGKVKQVQIVSGCPTKMTT